ncbi:WYL domain-containing protein [Planktothrix sp. FACHB-1355]|uniref:WYL domain-containing protein n=1 Tax=Aerosakkonema funiforme FACHB-1375 TaxID=2949571 RepID=A0A926VLG1_9CYAN|nr:MULTISPECIES: WYL domain-containing protein [Oscillatoriales]MBD2184619.1 WYL domain-containing protein [Aerosakkonema funiforme FACHB-1375]MBD3560007.1 WYL domain-containing protein [Planktothrix sp. FACHB-1355]
MPRKKETITLSIPPGTKEQLEDIAAQFKILWGDRPSISGLLVAIAQAELELGQRFTLTPVQVQALEQAIKLLIDSGYVTEAQTLMALLLERGNLDSPLRQSFLQQISQSLPAWRVLLDRQIASRQPFRLLYRDAQQRDWVFTVRYAEILLREKRLYLETWNEETEGNRDLPELAHNRSLRLDRIKDLNILPSDGVWRENLDFVKVYLHFKGELANSYESKRGDISDERDGNIRKVVRQVSSTFWLNREILAYRAGCEIVGPENVRDRFKREAQAICQVYDSPTDST